MSHHFGNVIGNVAWATAVPLGFHLDVLKVNRNAQMRYAAISESRAASQHGNILQVLGAHAARVINTHIHEKLVELHILLAPRFRQIVELHAGYGQHWLPVQFGVVEAVQQVDAAGARSGQTAAQPANVSRTRKP